jgi:hypothetical protein
MMDERKQKILSTLSQFTKETLLRLRDAVLRGDILYDEYASNPKTEKL